MSKKVDELQKEVKGRIGELADYNMILDKVSKRRQTGAAAQRLAAAAYLHLGLCLCLSVSVSVCLCLCLSLSLSLSVSLSLSLSPPPPPSLPLWSLTHIAENRLHSVSDCRLLLPPLLLPPPNHLVRQSGTTTDIDSITKEYLKMKERNDSERRRLETVYTERTQLEQRNREVEGQISQHQASMEAKLAQLAPNARNQYAELMSELQAMQPELIRMEADALSMQQEVAAAEAELSSNHVKQRALSLQEQVKALTERKYELEGEEAKTRMSPEEQVEELKAKIKRDNAENDRLQVQIRGLVDSIKKAEAQVGSVKPVVDRSAALASMPTDDPGEDMQQKYEELLEKERDLNQFLARFDDDYARKKNELQGRQGDVVSALEKMAKATQLLGNKALPDSGKFREMQDELEYKKIQVENAQNTQVRLKGELEMRRGELDKIDTLEDKIKEELSSLRKKKENMEEELVEFGKVEQLKVKAEKTKKYLEQQRGVLAGRKDVIKAVAEDKKKKVEAKQGQLQENDLHITLERLEQKIRTLEQGIFQMDDFVRGKEAEADFRPLANEVAEMVDALNIEVQKMAAL